MRKSSVLLVSGAAIVAGCLAWCGFRASRADDGAGLKPLLRRPVALVLADDGKWLFSANQRSGSISVIDTVAAKTIREVPIGGHLADLAATPDGTHLVAVDEAGSELIVLRRSGTELKPTERVKVSANPVRLRVANDGARVFVTSLWSRRLSVIALTPTLRVVRTVDLPFAPRELLPVSGDRKVIVADSFGGQMAVVDPERGEVESVRSLSGHNIRGLALSSDGKQLLVSHQTLNPLANTTRDDIHWGNLATNDFRALSLASVLDAKAPLLRGSDTVHLGDVGHGTADPAGIAVSGDRTIVALAGVGEVALSGERSGWQTVAVGSRPTAVRTSPDGRRAYVANTFGDSISIIDLKTAKVSATLALGPQPELKPSDRGELLFHDARLSHEGWLSCQSCHTDGHSNGRLADTLGDGTYGTPKRVPSLLGVKDTAPYAWNGRIPDLATQVRKSVETTMRGKPLSAEQVRDLTAYLETLSPPLAQRQLLGKQDAEALRRGREVFGKNACATCHTPPTYTSTKSYDVGLADESGLKTFNPPSLRGIGQGGPYFHDGRATTLAEVFTRHRHQLKGDLTKQELGDLMEFLDSL